MPDRSGAISLKYELDKILLLLLLILVGGSVCWMVHRQVDREVVSWWMRTFDNLSGAFLALLSGSSAKILQSLWKNTNEPTKLPD